MEIQKLGKGLDEQSALLEISEILANGVLEGKVTGACVFLCLGNEQGMQILLGGMNTVEALGMTVCGEKLLTKMIGVPG